MGRTPNSRKKGKIPTSAPAKVSPKLVPAKAKCSKCNDIHVRPVGRNCTRNNPPAALSSTINDDGASHTDQIAGSGAS